VGRLGLGATHRKELAVERRARDHVVLCGFGRVGSAIGEPSRALASGISSSSSIRLIKDWPRAASHASSATRAWPPLDTGGRSRGARRVTVPEATARGWREVFVACARLPILARFTTRLSRRNPARGADELIQPETEAAATLIRTRSAAWSFPGAHPRYLAFPRRHDGHRRGGLRRGAARVEDRDGGGARDQTLGEARVRERFGDVVAITKAAALSAQTHADTVLRTGDRVRVFGLPDQLGRSGERRALRLSAEGRPEREGEGNGGEPRHSAARTRCVPRSARPRPASWPPGSRHESAAMAQLLTWKPGRKPNEDDERPRAVLFEHAWPKNRPLAAVVTMAPKSRRRRPRRRGVGDADEIRENEAEGALT